MKKLSFLILLLGFLLVTPGCGKVNANATGNETGKTSNSTPESKEGQTLETVRLGVFTGGIDQYLAVAGQEKGIFEKHGIELEIAEFASGINTVDAIVTGQEDIGMFADYAGINRIGNTQEHFDTSILARYTSSTSYRLYVNPDEITDLSDLAGKGFLSLPGTILDYFNDVTYEHGNVDKENQVIINIDSGQDALAAISKGDAAAFWTTGTSAEKVKEQGMKEFMAMEDLGLSVDAYYVAANTFIEEHEQTVENFLSAIKETEEWITANPTEAAEISEKKTGIPKDQFFQLLESAELLLDFKQDSVAHLDKIKQWCVDNKRFEKNFDIRDFLNTEPLEKLFPEYVAY